MSEGIDELNAKLKSIAESFSPSNNAKLIALNQIIHGSSLISGKLKSAFNYFMSEVFEPNWEITSCIYAPKESWVANESWAGVQLGNHLKIRLKVSIFDIECSINHYGNNDSYAGIRFALLTPSYYYKSD